MSAPDLSWDAIFKMTRIDLELIPDPDKYILLEKGTRGRILASDKIEIKREMLSEYQLKIADLFNIPTDNVKKLVPNFFDKEKYVLHYENLQL